LFLNSKFNIQNASNKIIVYSSIAAACIIILSIVVFKTNHKRNQISNNLVKQQPQITITNKIQDTLIKTTEKHIANNISIKKIKNKSNQIEDEDIQQLLNIAMSETSNDVITEYLLNIGKEEQNYDDFDIEMSPTDSLNFEILLENL
jgi:predicted PurR-regulated permease PerM